MSSANPLSSHPLSSPGDAPIRATVVEEQLWQQSFPTVRYVVPQRFGMSAILGITTALSMLFGGLRLLNAPSVVYLFFGLLTMVICLVQMFFGEVPRMASTIAGAVLLPLFVVSGATLFDDADAGAVICSFIVSVPFGALLGYITGTCAAGVFLVMEMLEPYLPGGGLKQPMPTQVIPARALKPPAIPPVVLNMNELSNSANADDTPVDTRDDLPDPRVHALGPPQNVPVFNCRVLVSPRNSAGLVIARAAELAGIEASGKSEREALQQVVTAFKAVVAHYHAAGTNIPWLTPPLDKQPGDQERFIAVHL